MFSQLLFPVRAILRSINFRCGDFNTDSADACILVMACVDCARVQLKTLSSLLKFENCVKYANEITDDVIDSTQNNIMYINRAILANFQCRPLNLGRLIVLQKTHLRLENILFPWQLTLFQSPST